MSLFWFLMEVLPSWFYICDNPSNYSTSPMSDNKPSISNNVYVCMLQISFIKCMSILNGITNLNKFCSQKIL